MRQHGGQTPFIRNSLVIQDGERLTTVHGGTADTPLSVLEPPTDDGPAVYWAGDAVVAGEFVEIAYRRYRPTGLRGDKRSDGLVIARFDAAEPAQPIDVTVRESSWGVSWGSAICRTDGYTYVYGGHDHGRGQRNLRIARVAGDSLLGDWEYYTGDNGWSADERAAVDLMPGVANEFSVVHFADRYLLVTNDGTEIYSADIVAYAAPTPLGPFVDKTVLYTTPETGLYGTYSDPNANTYNALAHPHLDRGRGGLVVSYNVNWAVPADWPPERRPELVLDDVSLYRPRFLTVRFDTGQSTDTSPDQTQDTETTNSSTPTGSDPGTR
ncbi:DUF4185 domain-containing protein, partial [Nocardia cyriacigeorgica]|uniref:DUF4185 domain-containing protein n=1 Tax=Nocardia cyriacigeorgica TaxID=135487 RepID=UPI00245825A5